MRRNREERNKSILGESFIFTPDVIDDIHVKAELGRYRMRGLSLFKKIPSWDDLTFMPGTLTRFVIEGYREKCETRTIIGPRGIPFVRMGQRVQLNQIDLIYPQPLKRAM